MGNILFLHYNTVRIKLISFPNLKLRTVFLFLQSCQLVLPLVAVVRIYIQIGLLVVAQDIIAKIADMTKRAMLVKLVGPFLQFVPNIVDIMLLFYISLYFLVIFALILI